MTPSFPDLDVHAGSWRQDRSDDFPDDGRCRTSPPPDTLPHTPAPRRPHGAPKPRSAGMPCMQRQQGSKGRPSPVTVRRGANLSKGAPAAHGVLNDLNSCISGENGAPVNSHLRVAPRLHFMKVLITGGAGYIGSHTSLCLLDDGHEVVVLDNLVNSSFESVSTLR